MAKEGKWFLHRRPGKRAFSTGIPRKNRPRRAKDLPGKVSGKKRVFRPFMNKIFVGKI
jgi:hypothetical protein